MWPCSIWVCLLCVRVCARIHTHTHIHVHAHIYTDFVIYTVGRCSKIQCCNNLPLAQNNTYILYVHGYTVGVVCMRMHNYVYIHIFNACIYIFVSEPFGERKADSRSTSLERGATCGSPRVLVLTQQLQCSQNTTYNQSLSITMCSVHGLKLCLYTKLMYHFCGLLCLQVTCLPDIMIMLMTSI